jgi:hypothetical protein
VFFEITNGRNAVVQLRGRTLALQERYLHFATTSHTFIPIPIGIVDSPIQPYRIYNHGDVDVDFSFDLSALEAVLLFFYLKFRLQYLLRKSTNV